MHLISSQILTYIYHASHIITNPNIILSRHLIISYNPSIHLSWHLIISYNPSIHLLLHHMKPSIHLPYISSHYIQGRNMHISRQKHRQQTNHIIIQSMAYRLTYTCSSKEDKALITNKCIFM